MLRLTLTMAPSEGIVDSLALRCKYFEAARTSIEHVPAGLRVTGTAGLNLYRRSPFGALYGAVKEVAACSLGQKEDRTHTRATTGSAEAGTGLSLELKPERVGQEK